MYIYRIFMHSTPWGLAMGTLDRKSFDGTEKAIAQHVAGTAAENIGEKNAKQCLTHAGSLPYHNQSIQSI